MGESFIDKDDVCLILGDNIFYGALLPKLLKAVDTVKLKKSGVVFGYSVSDPERYGVVNFDENGVTVSMKRSQKA